MTKVVIKWSKWLSLFLLLIVLSLVVALGGLLFTQPGLGAVVWLADRFVPQLTIGDYQGRIFPSFTLRDVRYQDPQLHIDTSVNSLTLSTSVGCLAKPSICVDELAVQGVTFDLTSVAESTTEEPEATDNNSVLSTPVPLQITKATLDDINLNILGNHIDWESFATSLTWQGSQLTIHPTVLQSPHLSLAPSTPEPTSNAKAEDKATAIVLPEVVLPLSIDVAQLDINDFQLKQASPVIVNHLGLSARAHESKVEIAKLELVMPEVTASLFGDITLAQKYPLDATLNARLAIDPLQGQQLKLTATGSVEKLQLDAQLSKLISAKIDGQLQPLDPQLPFDVTLTQGNVQWPFKGTADYKAQIKRFSANGSLKGYQLGLNGAVQGQQIPDVDLDLKGKGNLSQINLSNLSLKSLGGEVTGKGMVNWDAPLNWSADLAMSNIQPGLYWQQAEGNISGKLRTSGNLTGQGGWHVFVPMLDIDGMLRQYPLNIVGSLDVSDRKGKGIVSLNTPSLVLSHGPNSITAKGKLEQQWNMDIQLQLPELAKTVPELKGSALGSIQMSGKFAEPEVVMALDVNGIDWRNEVQVASAKLQADVVPLPAPHGNASLQVQGVNVQGNEIKTIDLQASGTEQAHEVTLDVNSPIVSTSLAISGSYTTSPAFNWVGQLQRMQFDTEQGEWRLEDATELGFDSATEQATVGAHCWRQEGASVCLDETIKVGQSGEAQLSINQFALKQVSMFLPEKTSLTGSLDGQVWAKWAQNQVPELKASLTMPKGNVTQQFDQPLVFGWESAKINASIADNVLKADWMLDVTDNGDLSGEVTIPDMRVENKQIDGRLTLGRFNLDFLSPLVGEYSQLKSNIETDLKISGPLLHPQVNGQFVVDDVLLKGDISPIEVDSGRIAIDFTGYNAVVSAALKTPDGVLNVSGDGDWQDLAAWRSHVRVFADELKVVVPPMVKVKVIPDMTLTAGPHQASIDGKISLPWGRIVIDELPPSAVSVSKDLVLVDAQRKPIQEKSAVPFDFESNIRIDIGDDFKLSAFGLEGNLEGRLKVTQKNKGPFVTGEINIVNGEYSSFGQDLLISEGKILMNGPVDQPYVQITAIRNPENTQDDVTAGVKVVGPADEPTLTIFSNPTMPQANALSYLLRGQDIDGESGGNAMTTTLIGLSLAKSGKVVGEIGEAFGVQDLQLDTAGSGDDSQVTVSGYVLPGLQVKYGVGIFDSVGEFTVRYRLMKDLYLEAVSGLDSAVDLLYQFEFN